MPLISVIVPVYKVEQYLCRCVDSILAQTFSDFELILVDDGSPDRSGAMCDDYAAKDDRVRVIHKENGGLSSARNAGIDTAIGDYLMFVDSDDVIHPDCLRILVECVERSCAQIATGTFARFSSENVERDIIVEWNGKYTQKISTETLDMLFEDEVWLSGIVSACCKLFERHLFDNERFRVGRLFEDEFTVYKLYYKAKSIVFVDLDLYFYYINPNGITQNLTLEKRFDEYDAQWERLNFFAKQKLGTLYDKALMEFLHTAKWDLIACREGEEIVDPKRTIAFETQYETVFDLASARGILDFIRDYDYYVLAKPKKKLWWRFKRFVLLKKSRINNEKIRDGR